MTAIAGIKLVVAGMSFLSTRILGLLMVYFYPNATQLALMKLSQQPGLSLMMGLLAMSTFGFPLALVLVAWYAILLYSSRIFAVAWIGDYLLAMLGKSERTTRAFVSGLLLYAGLTLISVVGGLVTVLAVSWGLGSLLLMKKEVYVLARHQHMI